MDSRFFADPEAVLGTLARLFAADGSAREVAILTYSAPEIIENHYDSSWNGGTTYYSLLLHVPINLYPQIERDIETIQKTILEKAKIFQQSQNDFLSEVKIMPAVVDDPQWREKAAAWLSGSKITNQGRVRSDNVAPLTTDGLLFRSQPEIHFYKALKSIGVSFAPLAVFIRGGENYSRIEPDFVIIHNGIMLVVEIDGDTVHQESPVEAHARTIMLLHEGVHFERILASECNNPENAKRSVQKIMAILKKIKDSQ